MSSSDEQNILAWASSLDQLDYYDILGTTRTASLEQHRQAFHEFALRFHPDTRRVETTAIRELLTRIFERGAEAYRVLCDDALHARYRQARTRGALRLTDFSPAVPQDLQLMLKELHLSCHSAGAKLLAQRAAQDFGRGYPEKARQALQQALAFDGSANPAIDECMSLLETAL